MNDPMVAALCLLGASVFVLGLCFGGAFIAAGIWELPSRQVRRRAPASASAPPAGPDPAAP